MTELPKKYKAVVYDEPGKVSTKVVELVRLMDVSFKVI